MVHAADGRYCVTAESSWHWQSIDDSVVRAMPATAAEYQQLRLDYDLCLTGQVGYVQLPTV